MERVATLSKDVPGEPGQVAARLSNLLELEKLHPLLRRVTLEREAGRERVWRCEDRILGFRLVYFPHQVMDEDGRGYVSTTKQSGLRLQNRWRFESSPTGGTRITETLTFEGPALAVWLGAFFGLRAHRGLFAAF